jgi:protein-S-isoprenylcysteine O-methyltransferase Ste14
MKQALINLFTLTPKKAAFIQGAFVGLFVSLGVFNIIYGAFFEKNTWQTTTGLYQIIIGAVIFKD